MRMFYWHLTTSAHTCFLSRNKHARCMMQRVLFNNSKLRVDFITA